MKKTIEGIVLEEFFKLTEGRFYTREEKESLIKLIAWANGLLSSHTQLWDAIAEVDKAELTSIVDIQNMLLYASISERCPAYTYLAAQTVMDLTQEQNQGQDEQYTSKMQWYRRADSLDKGLIAYVSGDYKKAIGTFEGLKDNEELPSLECLCVLTYLDEDYKKLYEYTIRAQQVDTTTRVEIPWILELEKKAEEQLTPEEQEDIKKAALAKVGKTNTVGFVA